MEVVVVYCFIGFIYLITFLGLIYACIVFFMMWFGDLLTRNRGKFEPFGEDETLL